MPRDTKSTPEPSWISREDLQDIAKIGGDILKRTVSSSLDVIKDVTDTLPKDASQIINKSREEMMKGLSREFAQNLVSLAVEKIFAAVRDHRLDISIQLKKTGESATTDAHSEKKAEQAQSDQRGARATSDGHNSNRPGYQPNNQGHTQIRKNPHHRHRP